MNLQGRDQEEISEEKDNRRVLLIVFLFLVLVCLCICTTQLIPSFVSQDSYESFPYPIYSILTAAYSEDPIGTTIPEVKLSLIQEFIRDQFPDLEYDLFATLQVQLLTPVPTKFGLENSPTPTVTATEVTAPAQTATLVPTSTSTLSPSPTPPFILSPTPTTKPANPTAILTLSPDTNTIDEPGGLITYTVQVENNLNKSLTVQSLVDSDLGNLNNVGSCNTNVVIAPSTNYTCSYIDTISGDAWDVFNKMVTVLLEDQNANVISKSDTVSISISDVLPSGSVSVTANPT
jgi:hypothetical protein